MRFDTVQRQQVRSSNCEVPDDPALDDGQPLERGRRYLRDIQIAALEVEGLPKKGTENRAALASSHSNDNLKASGVLGGMS